MDDLIVTDLVDMLERDMELMASIDAIRKRKCAMEEQGIAVLERIALARIEESDLKYMTREDLSAVSARLAVLAGQDTDENTRQVIADALRMAITVSEERGMRIETYLALHSALQDELRSRGVSVSRHPFLDEVICAVMIISEMDRRSVETDDD